MKVPFWQSPICLPFSPFQQPDFSMENMVKNELGHEHNYIRYNLKKIKNYQSLYDYKWL